jgi:hypothetical protein
VSSGGSGRARSAATVVRAVVRHPGLWPASVQAIGRMVPPGWWRRAPYLPVPDADYWRFRMQTAYGDDWAGRPSERDVVAYLRWCQRAQPRRR